MRCIRTLPPAAAPAAGATSTLNPKAYTLKRRSPTRRAPARQNLLAEDALQEAAAAGRRARGRRQQVHQREVEDAAHLASSGAARVLMAYRLTPKSAKLRMLPTCPAAAPEALELRVKLHITPSTHTYQIGGTACWMPCCQGLMFKSSMPLPARRLVKQCLDPSFQTHQGTTQSNAMCKKASLFSLV